MRYISLFILSVLMLGCDGAGANYSWVYEPDCQIQPLTMAVDTSGATEYELENQQGAPVRQIKVNIDESDNTDFVFVNPIGLYGVYSISAEKLPSDLGEGEAFTVRDTIDYQYDGDTYELEYPERHGLSCEVRKKD